MLKIDLSPPESNPHADPILWGVAAGLADLFPPVYSNQASDHPSEAEGDSESERSDEA